MSATAGTAMAAAPASHGKQTLDVAKRGQVTEFAATSTFKLKLPKGDRAILSDPGVRFLNADGKTVGGMTRLDVKDKAGHVHKATWTLKGDRLTQKISGVKGSTVEGVAVRPTTPGQVTTRMDWTCFTNGATALASGVGVAATVAGAPETGGTALAATGPLISGTAAAANGVHDHCF
ncbi:hypothetical protein [Streptomyces sp. CB02923]|uniref:hypothetical protein n=1 Tax=Streptomyces sp. CB02923 TaxID=1718985 RepID=UPI001901B58F|nr:hypothetical protein [Streptomyces sp. CB02923]